ncbi:DUF4342 domain-containing protein [Auraticoccus monumenti]|uniref:DUF4342 domain-containing protein n=1 Tax=Auraticoccus monumenti TaxID=675864 RepID=A0A1G7C9Z4_9ACTN|nr:DUF4342 domain-containing protein [Auraticoccus monumenti]SDE36033.1 protein of unknown function [Auraticoccus monumenti]
MDDDSTTSDNRYEEHEVKADDLVGRVRELIHEGNVSRLVIKDDGEPVLELPLTAGVVVAAAGVVFSPVLVAVGAAAALLTRVTIGVERRPARSAS